MRHTIARPVVLAALVGLALWAGPGDVAGQGAGGKRSDAVVKTTVSADKPGGDGKQVITVNLAVGAGWHAYANPVGNEDFAPVQTKVIVDGKKAEEVQVEYPRGQVLRDPTIGNLNVYEGDVAIKVTVQRAAGDSPLKLKVKFQACNTQGQCLQPATVEQAVP